MKRSKRLLSVAALAAVTAVTLAACGSSSKATIGTSTSGSSSAPFTGKVVIGSANFPENALLANIYAAALKAKGINVTTQLNIGSREVYYKLIKTGQLTVLPEYNGALLAYLDPKTTATTEDATNTELKAKLDPALEVLNPAEAQDNDSLNVTKANADKYGLSSIADLSKVASQFTIGGPPEFKARHIAQLSSVYGLNFKAFKALDEAGSLTINALKTDKVQVADIFSTDPSIVANNFVTLTDPKTLFGVQNVVPLVYTAGVNSTITDTLNAISAKLDTATLTKLLSQVVTDKKDSTSVANDYVQSLGLG